MTASEIMTTADEHDDADAALYRGIRRLNDDGSITREWMLGHAEPEAVTAVTLTKIKVYPLPARRGPAWYWVYSYTPEGGVVREHGQSLVEVRRFVRRNFPKAIVVGPWAGPVPA